MRELLVIGMGPGHPDQITVQAVQALNRVHVFFRIDKGDAKSGLNAAREEILRRHVTTAVMPSASRKAVSPSAPPNPPIRTGPCGSRGSRTRPASDDSTSVPAATSMAASSRASPVPPRMRIRTRGERNGR